MKEKMYQRQWVCLQPQSLLVDLEEVSSQVFLTDMGLLTVAILMPAIPLILGIVLIGMNMPNQKKRRKGYD